MKYIRFFLFPFALLYDFVTTIRNYFFDVGIFNQHSFEAPIIVVGNLSVGGTGKTPQVEYLIKLLKDTNNIAVLSRGYKRKTKGYLLLEKHHTAAEVGDEPLQYYNKFKNIKVAVHTNRALGIQRLLTETSSQIILLDDAYQHRKVKASFYILLTKYNDLFIDDFLLPTGNLRENKQGAKRADVIIITKCPANLNTKEQKRIKQRLNDFHKKVFFTTISYANTLKGSFQLSISELNKYTVLLITGIANPNPLLEFLKQRSINYFHLKFTDHHHFTSKEIDEIQKQFTQISSSKKLLLTTEKDYVRLQDKLEKLSYIEIETTFLEQQGHTFDGIVNTHITENQHN